MHDLQPISEETASVLFECSRCRVQIRFPKEGYGEPSAVSIALGGWVLPDDSDEYLGGRECLP